MNKTFEVTSHGATFSFNTADWSEDALVSHVQRGIKQRLADSSASLTKKSGSTDEERLEACQALADRIQKGEVIAGGSGGGSRMSLEDKALKVALQTVIKFQKKEKLSEALERYTMIRAEVQKAEYKPEMIEKVTDLLEASDVYKNYIETEKAKDKTADMMAGLSF